MEYKKFYEIFDKYGFSESTLRIKGSKEFQNVWFGVMHNPRKNNDLTYWFGSDEDNIGYDFSSLDEFVNAKIFNGKSLKDVWDNVEITSLDCIDPKEYTIPPFEKSIVFKYKHKELSTYEDLKIDRKAWLRFLAIPFIFLLFSFVYFICSLTVITYNQPNNTILSSIFFGLSIITILVFFTIADVQRAKKVKQNYSFGKKIEKSVFYNQFEQYWKENFEKKFRNEDLNEEGLIIFGPFENCGGFKIKDTYFLFIESETENFECVFLNNYAKVWNKKSNDIVKYIYDNYKNIEELLNDIKTKNQIV